MTTERWALVPAESTVYMDAAGRRALSDNGCDNVEDQDAEKCYRAMLAENPGSALLAEVLAARDAFADATRNARKPLVTYEEYETLQTLTAALDKLGPAQPCQPGEHHE